MTDDGSRKEAAPCAIPPQFPQTPPDIHSSCGKLLEQSAPSPAACGLRRLAEKQPKALPRRFRGILTGQSAAAKKRPKSHLSAPP
jgi:hypothetical protein